MRFWTRRDPRLADELRFHRDRLIEDFVASGMDRQEAARRAFLEFGNVAQLEEACRDARGRWLDDLVRDLRYTVRMFRRSPAFFIVALLSLALGIGANTAIFTIVNAVMLRSLPVAEPERLVQVTRVRPDGLPGSVSYPIFEYFRDNMASISGAFAQAATDQAVVINGEEELLSADLVSGGYFTVLGLNATAGRLLTTADDVLAPGVPAAVISDRYWERRFGRSPAAVGTTLTIGTQVFTIVGVVPPSFRSVRPEGAPDLMLPLAMMTSGSRRTEPTNNWLNMIGRLRSGVTVDQANAEVQVLWKTFLQAQAARTPVKERAGLVEQRAAALPASDGINPLRYRYARTLMILMGIVGLVLMLACVNLSGLQLARAASRQRETSIRLAIGASRGRLVRQFLTESFVLAALGGIVGLVLAEWFSARLVTLFANGTDMTLQVTPDGRVLAFTSVVSLAACMIAGLGPAVHSARATLNTGLKEVRAIGHGRLAKALVIVQLAISMVLVVGATLFLGTLVALYSVDRGFDSRDVLVVKVRSTQPYSDARGLVVQSALVDALETMPGVRSASAAQVLPISGGLWNRGIQIDGRPSESDGADTVGFNVIAPGYFAILGTPLVAGREFDAHDAGPAPPVAVVNESFARYYFGGDSPLGRHVRSLDVSYQIVGVVRDAKYQSLRDPVLRTMYVSWMQRQGDQPTRYNYLVRSASGDPLRLVPTIERVVRGVDPSLRLRGTLTYDTLVERSIVTERIMAALGGVFAALALVVAAVGLFGVLAFQIARRTNEIGVRMALGATPAAIGRAVLRDVAVMLAIGIAIGGGAALTVTGLARSLVFGLTPNDPGVFAVAAAVLCTVGALAAWLPMRRATRVDPLVALRHE